MSISAVGNSDPYARYRQQALDLLASGQTQTTPTTISPSSVAPATSADQSSSSNPYATFKADLTALNQPNGGPSHAHGGHGHHHGQSNATADATDPTDPTSSATNTDPIDQALNEFADVLKSATDTAGA